MRESVEAGQLIDLPGALEDDQAATQAIQEAGSLGWFKREREVDFDFFYYWDTPSEMKEFIDTKWDGFEKLEDALYNAAQSAWAVADGDARLRVRLRMMIALWKKS